MPVLRARGLTKIYARGQVGITGLDLDVAAGEVFGFLGPNGAGKTTALRCMVDLIRPSSGQIEIFGADPRRQVSIRARIGYLPGELALYQNLPGRALLAWTARLRRVSDLRPGYELAERLRVDLGRHVHDLSRGNKQKLGVVLALMHQPDLVLLDEPTSGLDPLAQQEFAAIVSETREQGRTIVLSSHVLSEVEQLAGRVAILHEGRLVVVNTVEELKRHALRRFELEFATDADPAPFRRIPGVAEVRPSGRFLRCAVTGAVGPLLRAAAATDLVNVISHEPELEEIFLSYIRGDEVHAGAGADQDAA